MDIRDPGGQDHLFRPHRPHVLQQEAKEQAATDARRADNRDAIQLKRIGSKNCSKIT